MNFLRSIIISIALFSSWSAQADLPMEGHSGIFMMRGADTLSPGDYTYSVGLISNQHPVAGGGFYFIHDFVFNFNQGLSDNLEIGLGFPQRFSTGDPTPQTSNLNASLKYRLKGNKADGKVVSMTWFTTLYPAPAASGLGTGSRYAGLELNYTQYGEKRDIFLNYGLQQAENVSVAAGPVVSFTDTVKVYWKMGMEQRVNEHTSFVLGTTMHLDFENFGSRMMLGAAYRYRNQEHGFSYTIGMAYNILRTANEPRYTYMFGLNYKLASPKSRIHSLEARLQKLEAEQQRMESNMQQQQQGIDELQARDKVLVEEEIPALRQEISKLRDEVTDIAGKQKAMAGALEDLKQAPLMAMAPEAEVESEAEAEVEAEPEAEAEVEQPEMAAPAVVGSGQTLPTIQIVNESGVAGLAERYATLLRDKGYIVAEVNEVSGKSHEVTYIYYRPGYAEAAIAIGHTMPKNQVVLKSTTLPDGVDVLIMIGKDVQ
jgi:hypothetical protein